MKEFFVFNNYENQTTSWYVGNFGLYDIGDEQYYYTHKLSQHRSFGNSAYESMHNLKRFTFLKIKRRI